MYFAAQPVGHDVVDDVKAEADLAAFASRREERIERLASHLGAHAAAVIPEENFHMICAGHAYSDVDPTAPAIRKSVGE